jgi:hypothetical protein
MPSLRRSSEGMPIRADLVEAGLNTGFALLHLASTQSGRDARRVLSEARAACRDSERRMAGLAEADHRRLRVRCADLRQALARAGGGAAGARVLQMPSR